MLTDGSALMSVSAYVSKIPLFSVQIVYKIRCAFSLNLYKMYEFHRVPQIVEFVRRKIYLVDETSVTEASSSA